MRILMWNIQFFTNNRINAQPGGTSQETAFLSESALANLLYIVSTVEQADPDVFVVLETLSSQGALGTLGTGGGPTGILSLLAELRALHSNQWCAVPTLRVNPQEILAGHTYTESVGVFWRDDRVRFDGPYLWPAGNRNATGPSVPAGNQAATYPAPWNGAVPNGTTAAAQYRFLDANGGEITFTDNGHRRLYLTTFTERGGAGRLVRLFSMHTKPGTVARTAVARLTTLQAADWVPGNNQVSVFVGDFNLNLRALTNLEWAAIQALGFDNLRQVAISPTPQNNPPSRYLPRAQATAGAYLTNQLLDFALVRYGTNARPNPVLPLTVVNRVIGVAPNGLPAFTRDMGQTVAQIQQIPAAPVYNIAAGPAGAVRTNTHVTTITTVAVHDLQAGDTVRVAGVGNNTFNGDFVVTGAPTARTFTYNQPLYGVAVNGGGTATTPFPQEDAFRLRWNFGHLGPPAYGVGTSDHLPIFVIV